jgi:hypothetical protein
MDQWTYKGQLFESEQIEEYVGFVYLITDLSNNKKYVGKKNFWAVRKLPPLKGKTRRRTSKKESDWKDYFGSSEQVKLLVESHGRNNFTREILHLCNTKGEMSYLEAKEQFDRNVLFSDEYYNEFIGCKIHAKHVRGMQNV